MDIATRRRSVLPVRIIRARPRLFSSALVGLVLTAALPSSWQLGTRILLGWDFGVLLYLSLAYHLVAISPISQIRSRAKKEDEGRIAVLVLTAAAALASLGAIIAELGSSSIAGAGRPPAHLLLATTMIVMSWAFVHTIFALHYAYEFYDGPQQGGLKFPGEESPDYWDFVYFSFVIGMTFQVSDVAVTDRVIRRAVVAHGFVSFLFNTAILALMVNITASVI